MHEVGMDVSLGHSTSGSKRSRIIQLELAGLRKREGLERNNSQPSLECAGHRWNHSLKPPAHRIAPDPSVTKSRRSQAFGPPCRQRDKQVHQFDRMPTVARGCTRAY